MKRLLVGFVCSCVMAAFYALLIVVTFARG